MESRIIHMEALPKPSLEDKIVSTLKDDTLAKLVDDEGAITELVKRAIHEALFQPIRNPNRSYGSSEMLDSPVVAAARDVAQEYSKAIAKELVDELLADPENKQKVRSAIIALLPQALTGYIDQSIRSLTASSATEAMNIIRSMANSGGGNHIVIPAQHY